MSKFEMIYRTPRAGLDRVIEADTYKVNGKFFDFLIDKEVVRSLLSDAVLQIRRMADDEDGGEEDAGGDDAEDDLARDRGSSSRAMSLTPELDDLLAATAMDPAEFDRLLAATALSSAELDDLLAATAMDPAELDGLLAAAAIDPAELDRLLASLRRP